MMTDRLRLILALAAEPDRQRREHLAAELIESLFNEGAAASIAAAPPPIDDDGPLRMTLADDEPETPAAQPESAAEPVQEASATSSPSDPFGAALAASGGAPAPAAVAEQTAAAQGDGDPSALDRNPFE